MKTDLFQSCGHCWVFQICWDIECSNFTASSLRIWKSSTRLPSPPLALFIVVLPKAHLTSHSRMSGYSFPRPTWLHFPGYLALVTPSWLSGSWRSFLYSSSAYSCLIFLISSVLLVPYHFCPLLAHLCMKCSLGISNFLEEISSLSHYIFLLYFFELITEEGFLIYPYWSFELCIQMSISFLSSSVWPWSDFDEIPHIQLQRRSPGKMVGGVKSCLE